MQANFCCTGDQVTPSMDEVVESEILDSKYSLIYLPQHRVVAKEG